MERLNKLQVNELLTDLGVFLTYKFGYDENLTSEIYVLLESIIDYYDNDPKYVSQIIDALKKCKIEVFPTAKNDVSAFKYRNGEYISEPIVNSGLLEGVKKKIILPANYNTDSLSYRRIFLNQLIKLVWSSQNEFSQSGNVITQREGFKTCTYQILEDNSLKKLSEIGIGYETGFVDVTELDIMTKDFIKDRETAEKIYPKENDTYEQGAIIIIKDILEISESAKQAAITGNLEEHNAIFNEKIGIPFDEFLKRMDKLHELDNKRKNSHDDINRQKALKELEEYAQTQISSVLLGPAILSAQSQKKEEVQKTI